MRRFILAPIFLIFIAAPGFVVPPTVRAQTIPEPQTTNELQRSFRAFLDDFWQEIQHRNEIFLASVHPKLPKEMHDLFFDATLQMMNFSEETGSERTIECQEFNVCKVVYPQPNDSWAAQRFISYNGEWRWLDQ
jgi:hypothetical protein